MTFDPWKEADLIRFLRTFAQMLDEQDQVTASDVGASLGIEPDVARRALRRLRKLELLDTSPVPARLGNGEMTTPRIISRAGVVATLNGKLPLE